MPGSHQDAELLVELAKWSCMLGVPEAQRKIFADDFDAETADARSEELQPILNFFETVGTLVKNELLDRALVYDWLWVTGIWDRVSPAALRAREAVGVAQLFENFEALAEGQRK